MEELRMNNIEKIKSIVSNYQKFADKKISEYNRRASEVRDKFKEEVAMSEIKQNIWP